MGPNPPELEAQGGVVFIVDFAAWASGAIQTGGSFKSS
jgi:hypothetical protein